MRKALPFNYVGRFAPSPTGPLHAGSLVAALASWLDAKAHNGKWLVRIEGVDTPRCVLGADQIILQQLAACGLHPDEPPVYQSQRGALYQTALSQLIQQSQAYACGCSRQDIQSATVAARVQASRHGELVYPGTCRLGLKGKTARSWRFLTATRDINSATAPAEPALTAPNLDTQNTSWTDRLLGPQSQNINHAVGDFVIQRADGLWAYQLAVVVDDAAQGITHIVRGQDLADNTPRQILLQRALGLPTPQYLHTPLVLADDGQKLSKQNGAVAVATTSPAAALAALQHAGQQLNLTVDLHRHVAQPNDWLHSAVKAWPYRLAHPA